MLRGWEREAVNGYVSRKYATKDYEVVGRVSMLWTGWEGDTDAILLRLGDGRMAWYVLHCVDVPPAEVPAVLRQRLAAYREAITQTEELLRLSGEDVDG
jgi:hypothetical protein